MEEKVKFEFNINEVNLLLTGLSELPVKISLDLIGKIKNSADEQLKKMKEDKEVNK